MTELGSISARQMASAFTPASYPRTAGFFFPPPAFRIQFTRYLKPSTDPSCETSVKSEPQNIEYRTAECRSVESLQASPSATPRQVAQPF